MTNCAVTQSSPNLVIPRNEGSAQVTPQTKSPIFADQRVRSFVPQDDKKMRIKHIANLCRASCADFSFLEMTNCVVNTGVQDDKLYLIFLQGAKNLKSKLRNLK